MSQETPIEKTIREAKEKAATAQPAIETQAVTTTSGAVVHQPLTPQMATLDTLTQAGMNVDEWFKVNGYGIMIGSNTKLFPSVKVKLRLQDIKAFYGVRYGDPAVYKKSFDRVNCVQGGSWPDAISLAQRADPKCNGEYTGGDVIFTIAEDVKDDKGAIVIEAGKRVGWSTAPTAAKLLAGFIREIKDARKVEEDVYVLVDLTHVQRVKPNIQPWGVLDFKILEVLEEAGE